MTCVSDWSSPVTCLQLSDFDQILKLSLSQPSRVRTVGQTSDKDSDCIRVPFISIVDGRFGSENASDEYRLNNLRVHEHGTTALLHAECFLTIRAGSELGERGN